jgi:hypothetical protein
VNVVYILHFHNPPHLHSLTPTQRYIVYTLRIPLHIDINILAAYGLLQHELALMVGNGEGGVGGVR